jgi:hypothetical protein
VGAPSSRPLRDLAGGRLGTQLARRSEAYRIRLAVDLTLVGALLKMGKPEAALRAMEEHRLTLLAYKAEVEAAVADAVVEREAERVVAAAAADLEGQGAVEKSAATPRFSAPRRLVAAAAAVFTLVGLGAFSATRLPSPAVLDDAAEVAARSQLAAARRRLAGYQVADVALVTDEAHELRAQILALPAATLADEEVRAELFALLNEHWTALARLRGTNPDADWLLREVETIRDSLAGAPPGTVHAVLERMPPLPPLTLAAPVVAVPQPANPAPGGQPAPEVPSAPAPAPPATSKPGPSGDVDPEPTAPPNPEPTPEPHPAPEPSAEPAPSEEPPAPPPSEGSSKPEQREPAPPRPTPKLPGGDLDQPTELG